MSSSTLITLYSLLIILSAFTLPFDTQLSNKHGTPFNEAKCNKDTVIDFSFSSNSILTLPNTVVILILIRAVKHHQQLTSLMFSGNKSNILFQMASL